jgi:large subunit ribosomal protein L12
MKMEYVYAAMLLHKAGKEINEESIKKVLAGADVKVDEARVKALVAALKDVNIEEAIKKAVAAAPAVAAPVEEAKGEEKKEEKNKEEDKKAEESAAAGLGALFG